MAGGAATLSAYDEVLKTFYLPAIQEQLNHSTFLADKIEVNEEDVSGKNATIQCHYGRNIGIGARADNGALPAAGNQKFKTCTVPMRYQYGRCSFTGPNIAATRTDKGAYTRVVDAEMEGIVRDMRKDINRQYWGCGYGTLARWRSGTGTTVTLQKRYWNNSAGGDGFGSGFGAKYVEDQPNATWMVLTSSGSVITTITLSTTNVINDSTTFDTTTEEYYDTLTTATNVDTPAAGTYMVRLGSSRTTNSAQAAGYARFEMVGLRGLVTNTDLDDIAIVQDASVQGFTDNDPLQGLAVASYNWFKSTVDTHASGRYLGQRALTLNLMQKMFDKVEEKAGKDYGPDAVLTTRAIRREYLDQVRADRRHVNTMQLDGGWTGLDYNGIPLMVDNDAIDGEMYFLTMKDIQLYRMSDYDWMSKDGSVLFRIADYDAYEAVMFRYAELGIKRRNSQGVITDIAYDL
jgi:hypothetical protein